MYSTDKSKIRSVVEIRELGLKMKLVFCLQQYIKKTKKKTLEIR